MSELAPRPWWSRIIASKPPPLTAAHWNILGLVLVGEITAQYAASIFVMALPQIQVGLAIPEDQIGSIGGSVRIGMTLTIFITAIADRLGRRRLLLGSIALLCLATAATGLTRSGDEFLAVQFVARIFMGAVFMLGAVVIAEEFSARDRGWGIGALAMLGASGYAAGMGIYAAVDWMPSGWRILHFICLLPLLVLPMLARRMPETQRFRDGADARGLAAAETFWQSLIAPFRSLASSGRTRIIALCVFAFCFEFVGWPILVLLSKHLQHQQAYTPGEVSLVMMLGGVVGIVGNVAAGQWSDRFGRRPVVIGLLIVLAAGSVMMFRSSGILIPIGWAAASFGLTGGNVLLSTLASELFPTASRSTAAGMRMTLASLGGAVGFYVEAALYDGNHADAVLMLLPALGLAALAVLFLPEGAGRELEEVAPDAN
jgi:MFS family permease